MYYDFSRLKKFKFFYLYHVHNNILKIMYTHGRQTDVREHFRSSRRRWSVHYERDGWKRQK